tara:strand:+ start:156 stop:527 length:372 start_codon:yes stop_codon:yes gene_type:complete
MAIVIDLLIDLKNTSNSTEIFNNIKILAIDNLCKNINVSYESEGINHKILKNDMIIEIKFIYEINIAKFIKNIKNCRLAKIDAIYYEEENIKFLYCSKNYNNNQSTSQYDSIKNVLNYLSNFS